MLDVAVAARAISMLPHDKVRTTVAIIGAGFNGTLLAVQLLRRCSASMHMILIERDARHGSGLAYAMRHSSHRLNMPAAKMSACSDQVLDFLHSMRQQSVAETGIKAPRAGQP